MRPGTDRNATLTAETVGLAFLNGDLQVFSIDAQSVPAGYQDNVLVNPDNSADELKTIWFAQPFLGFLYVVAEFASGTVHHYWLQSGGSWAANTVYQDGAIVLPTTPNGLAYQVERLTPPNPTWAPETATAVGDQVEPTVPDGFYFRATAVSGANPHTGEVEPVWPVTVGATVYAFTATKTAGAEVFTTANPAGITWSNGQGVTLSGLLSANFTAGTTYYVVNESTDTFQLSATVGGAAIDGDNTITPVGYVTLVNTGATIQEFGDFAVTNQPAVTASTASPLATSITDRYGNSSDIAGAAETNFGAVAVLPTASTTTAQWVKGTLYPRGSTVIPTTNQGAVVDAIPNGNFAGDGGATWISTGAGAWEYGTYGTPYYGTTQAVNPPQATSAKLTMASWANVTPGQSVTISLYFTTGTSGGSDLQCAIGLNWGDATTPTPNIISTVHGTFTSSQGAWTKKTFTAIAPANAANVQAWVQASSGTASRDSLGVDLFAWNLEVPSPVSQFIYEAVQAGNGTSASTEPIWPTVEGDTVIDGTVTWEAVGSSIITWTAFPIAQSGATEPTWPTGIGQTVSDGNMAWTAISRVITDPNCPNTKGVALGASHVFAIDDDIVAYSAAVNPLDWSTPNNAGYLPTGLNNYGQNPMEVLSLYRGNLVAMNAGGYQMWQIDPDPANMALLDAQPVGSTFTRSAQSIATDNLFLDDPRRAQHRHDGRDREPADRHDRAADRYRLSRQQSRPARITRSHSTIPRAASIGSASGLKSSCSPSTATIKRAGVDMCSQTRSRTSRSRAKSCTCAALAIWSGK